MAVNLHQALCVVLLILLVAIAGCGGGGGFNANNVTVTVSPAAPTVPANGQVPLTATVNGLCCGVLPTIRFWNIQEDPSGSVCTSVPTFGPCPGGTIQGNSANFLTVTYFAPSTSGTYHVTATWQVGFAGAPGGITTKVGTSVITVP
jgi:hypothetical protein